MYFEGSLLLLVEVRFGTEEVASLSEGGRGLNEDGTEGLNGTLLLAMGRGGRVVVERDSLLRDRSMVDVELFELLLLVELEGRDKTRLVMVATGLNLFVNLDCRRR